MSASRRLDVFWRGGQARRRRAGTSQEKKTNQPGSNFDFSLEVAYRAYVLGTYGRLHPFLQPGVFVNRIQGANGAFAIERGFGVDYFLLEHFSIAGSTGVALNIGNIGGDPGVKVNLTTGNSALAANFYW